MIIDCRALVAAVCFVVACYVGARHCPRRGAEIASAVCAVMSGILWAAGGLLPAGNILGGWLNFAAAVLASAAGACLLP